MVGAALWVSSTLIQSAAAQQCPSGMVLVQGSGTIGMKANPYGIVATAHLAVVDAPEKQCPEAIASTPGATACWVQTDTVDPVVKPRQVTVSPFCIEAYPFPGQGQSYTSDGLSVWDAHHLNEILQTGRFGKRRMCSFSEFQVAVSGPTENRRFIFGDDFKDGVCRGKAIGTDSKCRNSVVGVSDYGAVHSHWVIADAAFVASACDNPPCAGAGNRALLPGGLVVAGGTNRVQTRQAPFTPHTWHDHGEPTVGACGFHGWDDQPVICADPGPETEAHRQAWHKFQQDAIVTGSMRAAISNAVGRPICN